MTRGRLGKELIRTSGSGAGGRGCAAPTAARQRRTALAVVPLLFNKRTSLGQYLARLLQIEL